MNLHIVVLAAGQGTRMKSALPKVLQPLAGRPLLAHVLDTAAQLNPAVVHVVYGHGGDKVRSAFAGAPVSWVEQAEQKGTGHAVAQAMPDIPDDATVLVMYGDVPMMGADSLTDLARAGSAGLCLLTVGLEDPTGYGRILRDASGAVRSIVEQKDATADERLVCEVNTGFLAAPAASMREWLGSLDCNNAQGEFYLTDCVANSVAQGQAVAAIKSADPEEILGVNDRRQLAQLERIFQRRQANGLLASGLHLLDPARFDLRGRLDHGHDCMIDVGCVLLGSVVLGDNVRIGPHCVLQDVRVGSGTHVDAFTHMQDATLGNDVNVGPYARLRPGTELADNCRVGNFVETKKAVVGRGSKINHLSYVGDAVLGEDVNVGAGTITCNYDGANKHMTRIGDRAFIGSNSALVAPVEIGADATVGAGSTISRDAPEGALTVARAKQRSLSGWQRPVKESE